MSELIKAQSRGFSGAGLHRQVCLELACEVPASTVRYHAHADGVQEDWLTQWRKLKQMCIELGENATYVPHVNPASGEMDPTRLRFVYIQAPYARQFVQTDAYLRLNFVDACHVNDHTKGKLLSVSTVTADGVIIPLACSMANSENNDAYEFLFLCFRSLVGDQEKLGFLTDQHRSIAHGISVAFAGLDPRQSECLHHLLAAVTGKQAFRDMVTADHALLFEARKQIFAESNPSAFERLSDIIERISYMGSRTNSDYTFEYVADSPAESLNAALRGARSDEFLGLFEAWLEWSLKQVQNQLDKLPVAVNGVEPLCKTSQRKIDLAKAEAINDLQVVKKHSSYNVWKIVQRGVRIRYKVVASNNGLKCSCRHWERVGLPCSHIYAVDRLYHGTRGVVLPPIRRCHYASVIRQSLKAPGHTDWKTIDFGTLLPDNQIVAPDVNKPAGRPRKVRMKSTAEVLAKKPLRRCSNCGKLSVHNSRTCPEPPKMAQQQNKRRKKKALYSPVRSLAVVMRELSDKNKETATTTAEELAIMQRDN